ncbi:HET-domain-containing protein [Coniochaeta ligniaria NRRL 30616]|uniref:HET-domain-containing protein n=1 Tax=Coniochaeta ligniaria NRRL 30616 TaxID=1408157 RepID=A0A1J7J8Y9_9PEZI|nr:HET-domain-containing protein [Coniochaeta ligniaria NRRL 30616]
MAYNYIALRPKSSEIRLLVLSPGVWGADIECDLHHANLDESPHYEALSYTWGDASNRRMIKLGQHPWPVTANLEVALRHLRSETEKRTLWIDALCINQDDLQERAEQVQRMRQIYLSASAVLAWLGEASDDSDVAMDQILQIGEGVYQIDSATVFTPQAFLEVGVDTETLNWTALWALWDRPYWSRIWVVQELASCGVLAAEGHDRCLVGCGSKWLPKRMLDAAMLLLVSVQQAPGLWMADSVRLLQPLRTVAARGQPQAMSMFSTLLLLDNELSDDFRRITTLLQATLQFKATDDHDRLYALLGLVREADVPFLPVPDYTKPVGIVFMELIKATIGARLDLECLQGNRTMAGHFGPTWIPELRGTASSGTSWNRVAAREHYRPSDSRQACVNVDEQAGLLTARGIPVSIVDEVVGPFNPTTMSDEAMDELEAVVESRGHDVYWRRIREISRSLSSSQFDEFWRALVLDQDGRLLGKLGNAVRPAPDEFGRMCRVMFGDDTVPESFRPDLEGYDRHSRYVEPFEQNLNGVVPHRCFIRTECGKFGYGPMATRAGDHIVILFGGNLCFVLRPKGPHYELVGDAYIQGVMNGELVREQLHGGSVEREFVLC